MDEDVAAADLAEQDALGGIIQKLGDCSIATGADSKIARQEQGEST